MLRYKPIGKSVITIPLGNGYEVVVIARLISETKQECQYVGKYFIKGSDIDVLNEIYHDELDSNIFVIDPKNRRELSKDITRYVSDLYKNGFLNLYIDEYKYLLKCFDIGDELLSHPDRYLETSELIKEVGAMYEES